MRLDRALLRPISIASSASAAFRIHSAWAFVLIGLALGVAWIGVEFAFWVWREGGHMRRTYNLLCRTSILYSRSRKGFSAQKLGFVCPTHFSELRIFPHFGRFNKTKKAGNFLRRPTVKRLPATSSSSQSNVNIPPTPIHNQRWHLINPNESTIHHRTPITHQPTATNKT